MYISQLGVVHTNIWTRHFAIRMRLNVNRLAFVCLPVTEYTATVLLLVSHDITLFGYYVYIANNSGDRLCVVNMGLMSDIEWFGFRLAGRAL